MKFLVKLKQIITVRNFRGQLILAITLAIIITSVLSTFVITKSSSHAISDNLLEKALRVTEVFAEQTVLGLLLAEAGNLEGAVETILQFPDIVAVGVYNIDGTALLERGPEGKIIKPEKWVSATELVRQTEGAWYLSAPVFYIQESEDAFFIDRSEAELLGHVSVVMNKSSLNSLVLGIRDINIIITFVLALILMLVLLSVTQRVTKPLQQLMMLMGKAQTGERQVRAELLGPEDIRQMEAAFNTMIVALEDREQELLTTRDDALESAKIKGEFAANVSHELRTPLNGILGMLELLAGMGLSPKQREYVNIARSSSDALLSLIDDILDFSKIDSGKMEVTNQAFNLRDLLDDVVSIMSNQAQIKGIDFSYEICEPLTHTVNGDVRRIRQLLINLCGNAVKFTNHGEVFIRVSLESEQESVHRLRFEVEDTGIGIPENALEKIFEAFSQADNSSTRKYEGTGLGLAICRQLVSVLNGEIGVSSIINKGSTFYFVIPIPAVAAQASAIVIDHATLAGTRFLVVDDSAHVRMNLAQILTSMGGQVELADSGRVALAKLREATAHEHAYEIVLVDEAMPSDDGIELLRTIKHDQSIADVKSVLMTNQAHTEVFLERFTEIDSYIQKPILKDHLLNSLTALISGVSAKHTRDSSLAQEKKIMASNVKVLVAEDNTANQEVALGMLERLGCKIVIAYNGTEAINLLTRDRFDIIFMDCNMPEMDGYEATRRIRELDGSYAKIPIIAMTANVRAGDRQKCLDAGMDDYLAKPLKIKNIRSKLENWLPDLVSEVLELSDQPQMDNIPTRSLVSSLSIKRINELKESVGSAFNNMLNAFTEDLPILVDEISLAIDSNNQEAIKHYAHSIKGSSKNFGADELANIARDIEDTCKAGRLNNIDHLLVRLEQEMANVITGLQQLNAPDQTEAGNQVRNDKAQKILIADDDRSMRMALSNVLDSDGYQLYEAANGHEALNFCRNNMPDLVLLDAVMPEMSGLDACRKIRQLKDSSHVPILMVTALDDEASIEHAFEAGATDYLPKPVHFSVLRQRISRLLHASRVEQHVRQLAYTDPLTGLPNRTTFSAHLTSLLAKAIDYQDEMVAILFLDLNRFKLVNDTMGHSVGDLLLKAVADRVQRCVRSGDMVARLGGDEFTLIVDRVKSQESLARIAQNICDTLAKPFSFAGQEIFVTTSIGISLYPADGHDIDALMKHADTAMFRAKDCGHSYLFYESDMQDLVNRKVEIEADLRRCVNRDEIEIHYQPKLDMSTNKMVGMEALVRWQHPDKGIISPEEFIPLAEETGFINQIGLWVMVGACLQAKTWHDQGYGPYSVSVNLSGVQLEHGDIIQQVRQVLDETAIAPEMLELEITESTIMRDPQRVIDILNELKAMGVKLAVDDFGTGYSSLNYLKRFPIDTLKIDATFVQDVQTDADDRAIIKSIIALADSMHLKIVAEGVETKAQYDILHTLGCDFIQGYYVCHPMSSDDLERRILKKMDTFEPHIMPFDGDE